MMCVFPIFPAVLVMWCTKDCSFMVQKIHIRLFGLLKKYHDISKYPATNKKGEGGGVINDQHLSPQNSIVLFSNTLKDALE